MPKPVTGLPVFLMPSTMRLVQPSSMPMTTAAATLGFGDHHQNQVDAANAGQHVADKALVAWNVNKAESNLFTARSREFQVSEAEIDGDSAPLLLFQTVGIDAGQGLDQGGLAMVDVSCGADDY